MARAIVRSITGKNQYGEMFVPYQGRDYWLDELAVSRSCQGYPCWVERQPTTQESVMLYDRKGGSFIGCAHTRNTAGVDKRALHRL